MSSPICIGRNLFLEVLESRCLLSLSAIADAASIDALPVSRGTDLAVADNGSFIVVSQSDQDAPVLRAVRYSAAGEQVGNVLTLDTLGDNFSFRAYSVDIDPDGDAVVAYQLNTTDLYVTRISKDGIVSPRQLIEQATI